MTLLVLFYLQKKQDTHFAQKRQPIQQHSAELTTTVSSPIVLHFIQLTADRLVQTGASTIIAQNASNNQVYQWDAWNCHASFESAGAVQGSDPTRAASYRAFGIQIANWLLAHDDANNDGDPGWGLPYAWDAFSSNDNPANQEYAVQDGQVSYCLLNAYQQTHDPKYLKVVKAVMDDYIQYWHAYTTSVDPACNDCGYFYYSTAPQDFGHFVKNINTWMGAVAAELYAITGDAFYKIIAQQTLNSELWEVNVKQNVGYLGWNDPSNHSHTMDSHMVVEMWGLQRIAKYLGLSQDGNVLAALHTLEVAWQNCGETCSNSQDPPFLYCLYAPFDKSLQAQCEQYILSHPSGPPAYPLPIVLVGVVEGLPAWSSSIPTTPSPPVTPTS